MNYTIIECLTILNCQGGVLQQLNSEIAAKYPNLDKSEVMTKVSEENKGLYKVGDKINVNGVIKEISEIKLGKANGMEIEFFTLKTGRKKTPMVTYYDLKKIQTKQMIQERGIEVA